MPVRLGAIFHARWLNSFITEQRGEKSLESDGNNRVAGEEQEGRVVLVDADGCLCIIRVHLISLVKKNFLVISNVNCW
jgi:hypothetical protein